MVTVTGLGFFQTVSMFSRTFELSTSFPSHHLVLLTPVHYMLEETQELGVPRWVFLGSICFGNLETTCATCPSKPTVAGIFFWVGGIFFRYTWMFFSLFPWKFKNYFLRFQYKGESFGCPTYWRRCLGSFEWKDWSPKSFGCKFVEPIRAANSQLKLFSLQLVDPRNIFFFCEVLGIAISTGTLERSLKKPLRGIENSILSISSKNGVISEGEWAGV